MKILWVQLPSEGWVACIQNYRAVVSKKDRSWVARVEDGEVLYPGTITFHAAEGAKAWAERKLRELAEKD